MTTIPEGLMTIRAALGTIAICMKRVFAPRLTSRDRLPICGYNDAGSPDRRIAGSPDRRIAGSPDRRIAGSPDRRIAGSPNLRMHHGITLAR